MLTSLISVKVVATLIGPTGVALVGQLNNFSSIALMISSGGINSGITKYVAEYKNDNSKITSLLSTVIRITVICSLITGVLMITFNQFLSNLIMLSPQFGYVFIIFGITVLLYALNMMITSIINGFKEFKRFVKINIANSIIGFIFSLSLVLTWGLQGALVSAVTFESVMLFITLWMVRKQPWLSWKFYKEKFSFEYSKKLLHYTLMTLATAATVPVSQMLLRGYVISEISPVDAGWWEAMNRISAMYLMIITSSFSVYYLPRLSELSSRQDLHNEIVKSYKLIVPILLVGLTLVYFLRYIIIQVLFTPDFLPMESLFVWQLMADFFKICSWLLAYLMIAKSMTKTFIITEIIFALLFIVLGFIFMQWNGVVGITQGKLINYILYLIAMVFLFRKIVFVRLYNKCYNNENSDNRRI